MCNLLKISLLKLCFEKLSFFKNVFSECGKCYFRDPSLEGHASRPPRGACFQTPLANSCLRHSAHTFGARTLTWVKGKENWPIGLWKTTSASTPPNAKSSPFITRKKNPTMHDYTLGDQKLIRVDSEKDLGITTSSKFSWDFHVNTILL